MSMLDEWSALATFLADMIEKYADVLEVDKMETAPRISDVKVPAQKNENPQIPVEKVFVAWYNNDMRFMSKLHTEPLHLCGDTYSEQDGTNGRYWKW